MLKAKTAKRRGKYSHPYGLSQARSGIEPPHKGDARFRFGGCSSAFFGSDYRSFCERILEQSGCLVFLELVAQGTYAYVEYFRASCFVVAVFFQRVQYEYAFCFSDGGIFGQVGAVARDRARPL